MSDCVCGFNPPDDCNPDCERCQLIAEIERLRAEVAHYKPLAMAAADWYMLAEPHTDVVHEAAEYWKREALKEQGDECREARKHQMDPDWRSHDQRHTLHPAPL